MTLAQQFINRLQDLAEATSNFPYLRNEIIINDRVGLEADIVEYDKIKLVNLRAFEPRKGHASEVMRLLTALADELDIILLLEAKPFGDANTMSIYKLAGWYQRFGFEVTDDEDVDIEEEGIPMIRYPF